MGNWKGAQNWVEIGGISSGVGSEVGEKNHIYFGYWGFLFMWILYRFLLFVGKKMNQRESQLIDCNIADDLIKPYCFQSKLSELIKYFFVYDKNLEDYMLKVIDRPEYFDFFKDGDFTKKIDECYDFLYSYTNTTEIVNNVVEKNKTSIIYNIDVYYQFIRLIEKLIKSHVKKRIENRKNQIVDTKSHINQFFFEDIIYIYKCIICCSIYSEKLCNEYNKIPEDAYNFNYEVFNKLNEIDVKVMTLALMDNVKKIGFIQNSVEEELKKFIMEYNGEIEMHKQTNCIFKQYYSFENTTAENTTAENTTAEENSPNPVIKNNSYLNKGFLVANKISSALFGLKKDFNPPKISPLGNYNNRAPGNGNYANTVRRNGAYADTVPRNGAYAGKKRRTKYSKAPIVKRTRGKKIKKAGKKAKRTAKKMRS